MLKINHQRFDTFDDNDDDGLRDSFAILYRNPSTSSPLSTEANSSATSTTSETAASETDASASSTTSKTAA